MSWPSSRRERVAQRTELAYGLAANALDQTIPPIHNSKSEWEVNIPTIGLPWTQRTTSSTFKFGAQSILDKSKITHPEKKDGFWEIL